MKSNSHVFEFLSHPFNYISEAWSRHKLNHNADQVNAAGNNAAIDYITDTILDMNDAFEVDDRAPHMILAGKVMEGKSAHHITAELSDFYAPLRDVKDENNKYGQSIDDNENQIWAIFNMKTGQDYKYEQGMNATDYPHFFEGIGFDPNEKIDNALHDKQKTETQNDYQSAEGWFGHMQRNGMKPGLEHGGQFEVAVPLATLLDRLGIEGELYDHMMDLVRDAKNGKAVKLGLEQPGDSPSELSQ